MKRRNFMKSIGAAMATIVLNPKEALSSGRSISFPGRVEGVDLSDNIIHGGHFTWSEATKNGTRIPDTPEKVGNIQRAAEFMEEVREYLGNKPIHVNSWYRDESSNRAAGGVRRSRHLQGDAVDFRVKGMRPSEVYSQLDAFWGNRGGLGRYDSFTHIDGRGSRARW